MQSFRHLQHQSSAYAHLLYQSGQQYFYHFLCNRLSYPEQSEDFFLASTVQARMAERQKSALSPAWSPTEPCRVGRQRLTALPQQVFTHPPSKPDLQLSLYPAFQLFLRLFSTVNFIMTFFTNYKSFSIHFRHHKNPIGYMLASFSVFLFYVF